MPPHTSWTARFNLLTMVNKSGNRNIAGFTGAMDFETNSLSPFALILAGRAA